MQYAAVDDEATDTPFKASSPRKAAQQTGFAEEPQTAYKSNQGDPGVCPEESREEVCGAVCRRVLQTQTTISIPSSTRRTRKTTRKMTHGKAKLVKAFAGNGDGKQGIRKDPQSDQPRPERLVRVLE